MGTFLGHVIPGSFFITFGLYWMVKFWIAYIRLGVKFHSNIYSSCKVFGREIPVDACGIVLATLYGMLFEGVPLRLVPHTLPVGISGSQHSTVYSLFLVAALTEIARYLPHLSLPPRLPHVCHGLAWAGFGMVFHSHAHGRAPVEQELHRLVWVLALTISLVVMLESSKPDEPVLPWLRTTLVVTQGCWFLAIAYILYIPAIEKKWVVEDMANVPWVIIYFLMVAIMNAVGSVLIYLILLAVCCGRQNKKIVDGRSDVEKVALLEIEE